MLKHLKLVYQLYSIMRINFLPMAVSSKHLRLIGADTILQLKVFKAIKLAEALFSYISYYHKIFLS